LLRAGSGRKTPAPLGIRRKLGSHHVHPAYHDSSFRTPPNEPLELCHARLQSARSSGEHWTEERAEQPLGFERAGRYQLAGPCSKLSNSLPDIHPNGAPPRPDQRETGDFPMRSPESSDIRRQSQNLNTTRRQMTVPEPEHLAERNLTPWAQVFSPKPSSANGRVGEHGPSVALCSARATCHSGLVGSRKAVRSALTTKVQGAEYPAALSIHNALGGKSHA
jgi:hypothetical protein